MRDFTHFSCHLSYMYLYIHVYMYICMYICIPLFIFIIHNVYHMSISLALGADETKTFELKKIRGIERKRDQVVEINF